MPATWAKMALAFAALVAAHGAAQAGQLEVYPVTLDLAPRATSTILTVTNHGTERTGIQIRGFSWSQTPGDDQLTPTRALLISPPIAELNPGESQTVRILLREPARGVEASYRLLVDELPSAVAPTAVRLALRLSLPLFVAPDERIMPDLQWRVVNTSHGAELQAVNRGTKRERVTDMALQVAGAGTLRPQMLANAWVLPGAERHWPLQAARGGELRGQAQLTAKSDSGAVNAVVAVQRAP